VCTLKVYAIFFFCILHLDKADNICYIMGIVITKGAILAQTDSVIDTRHPEWEEFSALWKKYRLAYLANEEYYTSTVDKFSTKESDEQWRGRIKKAYNALPCKNYVSKMQNMTWRKRYDYEYSADDAFVNELVQNDVDGKGSSLFNYHVNSLLKWVPTYGRVWIYTAMHSFTGMITLEEQMEQGLNPYLITVSPENVVNWKYKENSQSEFDALLMKTVDEKINQWGFCDYKKVYMLYRPDGITKYDDEGNKLVEYGNTIGKVPFSLIDIGESFLSDIVRIACAAVNLASGNYNFLEKSNFPLLTQKGQEKLEGFDAGAQKGVFLGPDGELKYTEYPTGSLDFNAATMEKLQELADRAASQKYESIATHVRQSGESQKENFKDVDAALSWINHTISEGLGQAIEFMGDYLGKPGVELSYSPPVTYLNESADEMVLRAQNILDIAADAKSTEMKAALSRNAYSPLLTGFEDKAQILDAEEKAIISNKSMDDAMRSAVAEAESIIQQTVPSQTGSSDIPDEG